MQINFEPEKIKAAKAYVDRLNPIKIKIKDKIKIKSIDNNTYTIKKEKKPSLIKSLLNFFFK